MKQHNIFYCFFLVVILTTLLLTATNATAVEGGFLASDIKLNDDFVNRHNPQLDISPHSSNFLGEQLDLASGLLSFSRVDGNLLGNFTLEVAYRTSYAIDKPSHLGWVEDVPRIENIVLSSVEPAAWLNSNSSFCSGKQSHGDWFAEYWSNASDDYVIKHLDANRRVPGLKLVVPGKVNTKLLYNGGEVHDLEKSKYVTKENWIVSCYVTEGREGFKATSPEGDSYFFSNYHVKHHAINPETKYVDVLNTTKYKIYKSLLVERIEDKFGNSVSYAYDNHGRITSITASDGRLLTLEHKTWDHKVLTANNRTWVYNKLATGEYTVTEPDNRVWSYDIFQNEGKVPSQYDDEYCPTYIVPRNSMTVTHPDGITGTFTFDFNQFGRVNLIHNYPIRVEDMDGLPTNYCTMNFTLTRKELAGAGLAPLVWQYEYSNNEGANRNNIPGISSNPLDTDLQGDLPDNIDPFLFKSTKVTNPGLDSITYYINRDSYSTFENKTEAIEYKDKTGNVLLTEKTTFGSGSFFGYSVTRDIYNYAATIYSPIILKKEHVYTHDTYTTENIAFNIYDILTKTASYNSYSNVKRYTNYGYVHDIENWVVNLPATTEVSSDNINFTSVSEITYKNISKTLTHTVIPEVTLWTALLPNQIKSYGVWQKKYSDYHTDGNIKKIEYNQKLSAGNTSVNRYQTFENYKRGIPQTVKLPNRLLTGEMRLKRVVNDNGWVTSSTDLNGTPTG
ncbi:MAG: RHS repeat protein, partial [Colwellia sp.]|nr:RHS repeat protein [Colwellia sp.]